MENIIVANALIERLIVEITKAPLGTVKADRDPQNSEGLSTCSITSRQITASNCLFSFTKSSAVVQRYSMEAVNGSDAAWTRAIFILSSAASIPVTVAPIRARGSESMPAAHPTSIILRPSSGLDEFGSRLKCLHRMDRIKDTRVGFITSKCLNGPSVSHQVSAKEAKWATSAGFSDEAADPPPGVRTAPSFCVAGEGGGGAD